MWERENSRRSFSFYCVIMITFVASIAPLSGCRSRTVSQVAPNQGYPSQNTAMQPQVEDGQWPMSAKISPTRGSAV
jgi:hypothetical protein